MVLCIGAIFVPDCFRFLVRQFITIEAWRAGVSPQIGSIDGSVLEPVTLRDSVWIYDSATGPITRVEIQSATAEFDWRNLLPRSTGRVFQRLKLRGINGKIQFPLTAAAPLLAPSGDFHFTLPRPKGNWITLPERIEGEGVNFIFQSDHDFVRLADTDFTLSTVEAGMIDAGQIELKQPWINRTFRNVRGTTAIQGAKVEIGSLTLEPDVQVRSFTAELEDLAQGRLNLEMQLAAFGGTLRVAAETLSEDRPIVFDATGTFSQISIARLASFLGYTDAAGGTIKEGKFTFRGPPQQIPSATASLRLEATNFQWDSRQWDSLVLGATLMNGRVQVPELAFAQGHNRLNLSGDMPLPQSGVEWWQAEFDLNIAAKIDNLTELSALMLPEFQYAAGKANIDGSIRGKDQQFHGQLIVSGSDLQWHNAPIEEMHASVKLNGNEFQITNVSLFNNGDYLRGHGVVNIIGDKQYWGEFHASIEDLAKYAAILQKPIVPEPLAGGAVIDWTGEGSAKGHSGQFSASLRKLRSLGATAALLHPINADFEGDYWPGMMGFNKFLLSDDDSSFTATVGIVNKAVSLQGMRLYNKQALWLEGDALLPLDLWNAWPNTSLATLLDDKTISKVNLTAYDLELRDASLLTGWKFPIQGIVRGNLVAEGPMGVLKTSGKFTLSKAQIPIGWSGQLLTGVEGQVAFDGQTLHLSKFTGHHPNDDFSASGDVDFTNLRDPNLSLDVAIGKASVPVFSRNTGPCIANATANLKIAGPTSAAVVSGDAQVSSLELNINAAELGSALFLDDHVEKLPTAIALNDSPWNAWNYDVAVHAAPPSTISLKSLIPLSTFRLKNPSVPRASAADGTFDMDLRLTGSGEAPSLTGQVSIHGITVPVGAPSLFFSMQLADATLSFRAGAGEDPSIDADASGEILGEKFSIYSTGTLTHPMRFFVFNLPLTGKIIRDQISGPQPVMLAATEDQFSLGVPKQFSEGVDVSDWPSIPTPPPEPVAPPAADSPAPAPATPVPATAPVTPPAPAPVVAPAPTPTAAAPAASSPSPPEPNPAPAQPKP